MRSNQSKRNIKLLTLSCSVANLTCSIFASSILRSRAIFSSAWLAPGTRVCSRDSTTSTRAARLVPLSRISSYLSLMFSAFARSWVRFCSSLESWDSWLVFFARSILHSVANSACAWRKFQYAIIDYIFQRVPKQFSFRINLKKKYLLVLEKGYLPKLKKNIFSIDFFKRNWGL